MKAPFSLFLALRYLKPKRTFVSVITVISILGVTLGIAVLILVISVMTGFEMELRNKVLGFEPHILVQNSGEALEDWQPLLKKIGDTSHVRAAAPFVQGLVIAQFDDQRVTPVVRGIDATQEQKVTDIAKYIMKGGSLDLAGDTMLIGSDLAFTLGVHVGDKVTVYSPGNLKPIVDVLKKAEKDPKALEQFKELPMPKDLVVTGIFKSGSYAYDANFMFVPLNVAQELFGLSENDMISGISLKTENADLVREFKKDLQKKLPAGIFAQTWEDRNKTIFEAISMERYTMFFILQFIVIVAAFGIMNTLITVTVQKTREIGIMKALGATTSQIVCVFLGQGMVVGFLGNLTGLALGMTLVTYRNGFKDWLGQQMGIEIFSPKVYGFSELPAQVVPHDVAVICISAFVICSLAALIPAYFAARLDPVRALRQE